MIELAQMIAGLSENWSNKTLTDLRYEAAAEETGIAFDAAQINGERAMIAICFTSPESIRIVEKIFDLSGEGEPADWSQLSLAEFVMKTGSNGFAYEDFCDGKGNRTAVAIAAVGKEAVALLERIFTFPR